MKKIVKRLTALMLAVLCLVAAIGPAYAATVDVPADDPLVPEYTGISSLSCSISVSSGTATCRATALIRSGYHAYVTMKLQESSDKSSWWTAVTWQTTGSMTKTHSVSSGKYHRVQVIVKVYNSDNTLVETVTINSSSTYY